MGFESMVSQLGDLTRLTMAVTNRTFLALFQCFDDARPAKHMSALCWTLFLHLIRTNTAKSFLLLCFRYTCLPLETLPGSEETLFFGCLGLLITKNWIDILSSLDKASRQEHISFNRIANISDLINFVRVAIWYSQECLDEGEVLVPVKQIHNQSHPLNIAHKFLSRADRPRNRLF